jgi:histidinol-phosphate aminotransferase
LGLLDYYKQFEDMEEEEVNAALRERRRRDKALELERVPTLDLSSTEWPDLPNSEVANASIFVARGRLNGYPDRHATQIRSQLAERHQVAPEQIVLGNGVAELLQTAAYALLSSGDELVTQWPSYPLYPLMASRAGARPVAVDAAGGAADPEGLLAAVTERTRLLTICNPNDPTGHYLPAEQLAGLVSQLPDHVVVLVDEALAHFQEVEPLDSVIRLVDAFPRLLVFRTFSKVYGLSGLRAGYVVGSAQSASLLERLAPALGVNALTQAGIAYALRIADRDVEQRRALVIEQRRRLEAALHDMPVDAPPSQANFTWLQAPGFSGPELAGRLEQHGVIVAAGSALGAEDHVRASIRDSRATERLLFALREALRSEDQSTADRP